MPDWYVKKTLASLLDQTCQRWTHREALYFEGRRWSFDELRREIDKVAQGLVAIGIAPGENVALWMPNRPEWIFTFFALSKIGAVTVPINTRFRTVDVEYVLRQSDATTLITVDRSGPIDYLGMVEELIPEVRQSGQGELQTGRFPELKRVVVMGDGLPDGVMGWQAMLRRGEAIPAADVDKRHSNVDPDDTTLILYTSGTTGFPKGVMHSHAIQRNTVDIANRVGYRSDDVVLLNWPLFHVGGLYIGPLFAASTGCRIVMTETFDPEESLRLIQQERVTRMWGFDTHLEALLGHPTRESTDLGSLRTAIGPAGMVSTERTIQRTHAHLCTTVSGWGMSEIGAGVAMGYPDGAKEDAWLTSGYALPDIELKVIDPETGQQVGYDELGELCARGYSLMKGYYKKPEETAKAIDADGWLHTGDLASMREDGAIRLLGRYKDLLKVGGENVDAAEVESFLLGHPAIAQVQIIGVPDARLSEVACACVVPRRGMTVSNDDLATFCRGKLASFKIPRYTFLLDEFPMTASGKPQKFKLREMAAEKLALKGV